MDFRHTPNDPMPNASEREVIRLAQAGDPNARESVAVRFWPYCLSICRRFLPNNNEDAIDAACETRNAIYKSIHLFRGDAELTTWIFHIARHICFPQPKSRCTDISFVTLFDDVCSHENIEDIVVNQATIETVLTEAISQLSKRQRRIVRLFYGKGLTYTEIEQQYAINGARQACEVARKRLRVLLSKKHPDLFG